MDAVDKERVQRIVYEMSKGSKYFENEKHKEALIKRMDNLQAQCAKLTEDISDFQTKRRRVDPSIYEDKTCLHTNSDENPRTSQRIHSGNKHSQPGFCSEIRRIHSDMMATGAEIIHAKRRLRSCNSLADSIAGFLTRDPLEKRVPVGPSFQVKVPEWDAKASATSQDLDHRQWLGTQIWPPERENRRILIERDPIEKCRQESCGCEVTGSVECVRFHVVEKRIRLKLELDSAFDDMGFDSMGEDVTLSWSEDEERRFKAMVRLNRPSLDKNFWGHLYMDFPSKGIQGIVSYYYNVFLLRRRSYQNRAIGENVDTDDEERDFEFLHRPLRHDVAKVRHPESNCVKFPQNIKEISSN